MGDKDKKSGLKKFFQENRSLVFTVPVFVILVIAVILVYVLTGKDNTAEAPDPAQTNPVTTEQPAQTNEPTQAPSDSSGTEVTTLPQDERDRDQSEIVRNPFAAPYRVSGIIYDKSGNSLAIIEAENKTYIVEADEQVGEYFTVLNIESDKVVLEVDGQEIILTLSGE